VFTRASHWSLSLARSIQSILPHPISLRSIRILSSHLRLCIPSGLFPSCFPLQSQSHVTTDDQSVSKSWFRGPSGSHDRILIFVSQLLFCQCRAPPLTEVWSVICINLLNCFSSVFCCWPLAATLSRTAFGLPSSHQRGTSPPTT
jgi:hypothetical protein